MEHHLHFFLRVYCIRQKIKRQKIKRQKIKTQKIKRQKNQKAENQKAENQKAENQTAESQKTAMNGMCFVVMTAECFPIWKCIVGCIENLFSSVSTNKGNQKLPFDMGFKNIIKFFKNVNVSCSHQRAEVTENRYFHENRLFSVKIFLYSTTSMLCHISLERSANTEKNGI